MMTRVRSIAALVVVGLASFCWPRTAMADSPKSSSREAEVAAQKGAELRQTQLVYGGIVAGVVVVVALIFMCLNTANKRGKAFANRHKRKRPLDTDAPLAYDGPLESEPPVE